jgi:hypothetical protein
VLSVDYRDRIAWVRIDLNPAPLTASEIYDWLRRRIIADIKASSPDIDTDSLQGQLQLYRKEVEQLEKIDGELLGKDSPEYRAKLASRLENLRQDHQVTIQCLEQYLCTGRGRLLIIALDNCDKRNRDEQLLMFQVAKYIQNEIRCLVILPLRHETFENHRNEPPLDTALKDLIFRIEPPSFQEVLKKRLGLVLTEARKMGPKKLIYHADGKAIDLSAPKLERFLHALMGALFDHEQYGRKMIVGLAGWNIRKAFEIFLEFARSGYIHESDIFRRQATNNSVENLPQAVVARVLFRTNRRFYDGDESYVKNLFQIDPATPAPLQFLRYWILSWLRSKVTEQGPSGIKGYHSQGELVHDLIAIGADEQEVRTECRYLAKAGCILPEHLRSDNIDDSDLMRITPAGYVHLELAHQDLHYLATCAEDTWVEDRTLADNIRQRIAIKPYWRALSWPVTLQSAFDFCQYLQTVQSQVGAKALFLAQNAQPPSLIRFEEQFTRIEYQQNALKHSTRPKRFPR